MTAEERLNATISWGRAVMSAITRTYFCVAAWVLFCPRGQLSRAAIAAGFMVMFCATLRFVVGLRIHYLQRRLRA